MPRYNHSTIEPKWRNYWAKNRTFATPAMPTGPKLYVLDMFPYPSGDGLHVGHPEGYTATDIVCRYHRMLGKSVMHPMGWDAFGLPAEQHAKKTGTPPRVTTVQNIATFREQLQRLGFSYDWDRELATTDVGYFRWTQWIFLQLFDTWFDDSQQKGRPIAELPIPVDVTAQGEAAVRRYRDEHRLAYQLEAPVNWCPALGTVLANEEVQGGVSERGGHPVVRIPLRQWMLRITAYADRLEKDLEPLDWSEGIKALQRNWIGRSTGAYVDFFIGSQAGPQGKPSPQEFKAWRTARAESGFPRTAGDDVVRVYTTRPDTLYGATYMVIAPEHPLVARLTRPEQAAAVTAYCEQAARKSDLDRTDLAKTKTGVFTGSFAANPANQRPVPIWVADYVLAGVQMGAIMAVPAHDNRDFEFARLFNLPVVKVVEHPSNDGYSTRFLEFANQYYAESDYTLAVHLPSSNVDSSIAAVLGIIRNQPEFEPYTQVHDAKSDGIYLLFRSPIKGITKLAIGLPLVHMGLNEAYTHEGIAINSSIYNGLSTADATLKITADMAARGVARAAVNYKLRDWLFSRQHFWGEPFPILHELDADGKPTGAIRAIPSKDLPVDLPAMTEFKSHGTPEPPLEQSPQEWLYPVIDGVRYKRETNTMPQWAGSCWYYLRFLDPKNEQAFIDPAIEKAWMPVDLYIGGAEHAVLHLLYARFWHKVLYDRGHVSLPEPFQKLVNQGMILGEREFHAIYLLDDNGVEQLDKNGEKMYVSASDYDRDPDAYNNCFGSVGEEKVPRIEVVEKDGRAYWTKRPEIELNAVAYKMSKSRGNVINPNKVIEEYGADALRLYEMFMGPLEATKPWNMEGVNGVRGFLDRVWRLIVNERAETVELNAAVHDDPPTLEQSRVLHKTIAGVTQDLDRLAFNTVISKLMELTNYFTKSDRRPRAALETLVLMLSPLAPHLAEELWHLLGHDRTLAYEPWPIFDPALVKDDTVEIPVQFNGKLRTRITVPADTSKEALEAAARGDDRVAELLAGQTVMKVVVVPGRMVNFVVK